MATQLGWTKNECIPNDNKEIFFRTSTSKSFPHLVGTNVSDDEIIQALLSSWHEN